MKIVYMGTPDFAVPCLKMLAENDKYEVCCVLTQPDKAQGRKMELTPSPVKQLALQYGIEVYQPDTLKTDEAYEKIASYEPDYIVVAAYGKILPQRVLDIPKFACINIHGSLLPEYRGAAPIQRAVIDGKKTSGLTSMLMGAGLDTGDMLLRYETEIGENETAGELFDRLALASPALLEETLDKYSKGEITPEKQDDSQATYAAMLSKEEALIDWNESDSAVHNKVRGMYPWPAAYTFLNSKKLKIHSTVKTNLTSEKLAGTVLADKNGLYIVCGNKKLVKIEALQLEGSKKMTWDSFFAGRRDIDGIVLG